MKNFRLGLKSKLWVKIVSWTILPLYVLLGFYLLEYMNFRNFPDVFKMWDKNMGAHWFALIIVTILSIILLLLVKKLWIFTAVYGGLSLILGTINCIKIIVNGDYFYPWDITMAGNMGELMGFAEFSLPPFFFVALPIMIVVSVLLWFGGTELAVKWYYRVSGAILVIIPVCLMFNNPAKTEKLLGKFKMSYEDSVLQSANYQQNGFVNAFTINCFALKISAPDGYNAQSVTSYLSDYTKTQVGTETPDIVVVMSEAFYDIRQLNGTTFSQNPLENYDEIITRDNAITGNIYTTAHGGGTVRTEFEVLTGLTVDYLINGTSPYLYITRDTAGYVSNYKEQGYRTTAIHTYDKTFYLRDNAYPLFGFDEYIASDTIKENYTISRRRGYITDDVFMDVVINTLETHTDKPNFIFGITMENHGKYDKSNPEDIIIEVQNDKLEQAQLDSVTTYTQGLYNADLSLKKLIDYVDNREKPTIVLFFGDHKPALGGSQAAYNQAGNIDITDGYDTEEKKFVYSTQYLMYANYDVDYGVLEQSPDMSGYYMLTHLAKVSGTSMTPFMQYLYDSYLDLPYYNVRLGIELDKKGEDFINSIKLISYDRIKGKEYSVN